MREARASKMSRGRERLCPPSKKNGGDTGQDQNDDSGASVADSALLWWLALCIRDTEWHKETNRVIAFDTGGRGIGIIAGLGSVALAGGLSGLDASVGVVAGGRGDIVRLGGDAGGDHGGDADNCVGLDSTGACRNCRGAALRGLLSQQADGMGR